MHLLEFLPTIIGAAAVAPALLILWLVIAADERPGPPGRVWAAFLLGAASVSLLGLARAPFLKLLDIADNPVAATAMRATFGVAAPEEIVKVLVIIVASMRRPPRSDPMDTVVYGAAAGLGFAAYENLAYLVMYPDMWLSLALLRSVLTVPFHGALGVIAGAYLAVARSGTALGAHRHNRDWAKLRACVLIVLAPIALHAAFDAPLLILQENAGLASSTSFLLESTSMLIGFGTIAFAVHLVRRVGRHHAPRTETSRQRLSQLRRMWALLVAGGGASFAGTAFILTELRDWMVETNRTVRMVLVPLGSASLAIGAVLLAITAAAYILGRARLRAIFNLPDDEGRPEQRS